MAASSAGFASVPPSPVGPVLCRVAPVVVHLFPLPNQLPFAASLPAIARKRQVPDRLDGPPHQKPITPRRTAAARNHSRAAERLTHSTSASYPIGFGPEHITRTNCAATTAPIPAPGIDTGINNGQAARDHISAALGQKLGKSLADPRSEEPPKPPLACYFARCAGRI